MKRVYFFILSLLVLGFFNSCKQGCTDNLAINFDEKAKKSDGSCLYGLPELNLKFNLIFKGENLDFNTFYADYQNRDIAVETFRFYISDVTLIESNGTEYVLSEVELVDFSEEDTLWLNEFTFKYPPDKNFTKIKFGLGLNPTLNNSDPSVFEFNNPLSIYPGMYWVWATKYIFAKVEGKIDGNQDGTADQAFFYHVGLDKYYQNVDPITINISTILGKQDALNLGIDVMDLFNQPSDTINYQIDGQTHTDDNEALAERFLVNLSNSFKVID